MDARRLKRQRMQMAMTQDDLAEATGYGQPMISMMEAGKQPVSVKFTKAMDFVRREHVRQTHFRRAAEITGRTEAELEGIDVEGTIAHQDAEEL